ncbi:MAG TPA: PAS domain-containing protein [Deltaproteobacteria bacterium]|nr:PAS domain-containing protein [Deltaproteobacteria bacterium]
MAISAVKSESGEFDEAMTLIRGKQAEETLNVAIVGGGKACYNLLKILDENRQTRLKMKILGVADVDPDAPGLCYAKGLNLFTTDRIQGLFDLDRLNLIIELTGSAKVKEAVFRTKPSGVSIMDHVSARLLWDLVQIETEKMELEREHQRYAERAKKQTQVILDSLPYRIMVINLDFIVETVNQTFLKEFDFTRDDILGKHCYEARYGLDKPCKEAGNICYLEDRLEQIKEKGSLSTIKEYVDENGETRFDVITLAPIFDEQGKVIQLLEASRDVSERLMLEREMQKSNIFFQNVIQSTVDGIVVVDTKGNVLIFNEGMENLTGYTRKEIMEHGHLASFYNIDVAKENMKKMRSDQHGLLGKLNPTSMSITTKEGKEVPVTISASIITINDNEVGSVGVFTDMREVLQMRKDLEDAHLQLVQSEKIASVGRMAAGVAHEINNPLAGALIYAELLKEELQDDPKNQGDIQEVINQTLRCKKIVAELLEFSRQSIGQTSSFSLEYLINQCLNLLINQVLFQDIRVKTEIEPDIPEMVGDMGQLQQVFTNLFINAAHAMEEKGMLKVVANYQPDNSRFVIKVSDTGPGIPAESRDKIFDIFFTTKPVGKGTGLGLSITQNIIQLHGGTISFDCPPGGGTTFTIELPLEFNGAQTDEPVFVGLDES